MREAVGGMDERVRRAGLLYERVVFTGDAGPLAEADRELDAAEADLAVARGRLIHARFLLRRDQDPAAAEEDPGAMPVQPTAVASRNTGPPERSPMARLIARTVRGASGIVTTLPSLRAIVRDRWPRSRSSYIKVRKQRRKARLIEMLDGCCVHCETTENLEFDHIDPSTKRFNICSDLTRAWDDLVAEARKTQLLCKECHREKGAEDRPEPAHSLYRYWYYGCRCAVCRAPTPPRMPSYGLDG